VRPVCLLVSFCEGQGVSAAVGMNALRVGQRQRVSASRSDPTCGLPCTSGRPHSGQLLLLRRRGLDWAAFGCSVNVAHGMSDPSAKRDKVRAGSSSRPLSGTVWKRARHASVLQQTCESLFASSAPVSVEVIEHNAAQESEQLREKAANDEDGKATPQDPGAAVASDGKQPKAKVPVYVMLQLDTVWRQEQEGGVYNPVLKTPKALNECLQRLKAAGVTGVMVDVWWGMAEAEAPRKYNFDAYLELLRMAALNGLKVQAVMSFHAAGGNVGDNVNIPLPDWVLQVGKEHPDVFYTDASGCRNPECLSLGCDNEALLLGRTPVEAYRDFVQAFLQATEGYLGWVVSEVTVGLGPAGEMRYPSYPEGDGRWRFPGIGEFQCYDKYMLADLKEKAREVGHPEWGHGGPHDSGNYTKCPWETGFFDPQNGSYKTEYGDFFLQWYSGMLIDHADRVLGEVAEVVRGWQCPPQMAIACSNAEDGTKTLRQLEEVKLGIKLAGVHWWYKSSSHAGELTAGYYNTRHRNGYKAIMEMLGRHSAVANFTAVEMRDCEQPEYAKCSPQGLLAQLQEDAFEFGIPLSGENALQRYDKFALDQIEHASYGEEAIDSNCPQLKRLTFLRMGQSMFDNWDAFESFIARMNRRVPGDASEYKVNNVFQ